MALSEDRGLAERFLGEVGNRTDLNSFRAGAAPLLLARRHGLSELEADFVDRWGPAIDAAELAVATMQGLLPIACECADQTALTDDEVAALMISFVNAEHALNLGDDIIALVRRGSLDTAFSALRTQIELCTKTTLLCREPALARPYAIYSANSQWLNSAAAFKPLMAIYPAAKEVVDEAYRESKQLRAENSLLRSDLGWAHDHLLGNDSRYASLVHADKRTHGPNLGDLEHAIDLAPQLRGIRAQANAEAHGNRLRVGAANPDEASESAGVLLLTGLRTPLYVLISLMTAFKALPTERSVPEIAAGLDSLMRATSDRVMAASGELPDADA